ncbi:hypothetical protein ACQKKX_10310 [Neorhizobium sp. NPDC001467]|uniref:hypothetical protein n=1 Tax=Neorhizobium sp. NPDC001467 TaxID=3390595 RepID=UPI003D012C36
MKKPIRVALILAVSAGSMLAQTLPATAQWRDGPHRWDDRRGPPPPPRRHHRDHDNGKIIAGGLAAGVIGGLIGGALANGNSGGPRYYVEEPPPPRCWFEDRRVQNAYDGGWHYENVRVCN